MILDQVNGFKIIEFYGLECKMAHTRTNRVGDFSPFLVCPSYQDVACLSVRLCHTHTN